MCDNKIGVAFSEAGCPHIAGQTGSGFFHWPHFPMFVGPGIYCVIYVLLGILVPVVILTQGGVRYFIGIGARCLGDSDLS